MKNLITKLESGEVLYFQDTKDNKFLAVGGCGKAADDNYRRSYWHNSIENCDNYLGSYDGPSIEDIQKHLKSGEWKYISSRPHAYGEPVEAETEVIILDNAKEECKKYNLGWSDVREEMIGKTYEIKGNDGGDYQILNGYGPDWSFFPRTAFVIKPIFEEENDKMKEAMDLLKENGYKIIKE